ncbi:MAG: NAD(P)-dependent oxidoreductase [Deltaproteobacteria bacterium]|nr:NAD(P)-dependent oxidoreductase [Myxococcales bacterium]MDP3215402.1 NAD(P)-dependent oxidoreductase [Deltaproteobacteria bacterium]
MRPIDPADLDATLAQARDALASLRGARIFLTGATGFYGAWLLESLAHARRALDLDLDAVVLTRDPARARARFAHLDADAWLRLHPGDARDFPSPDGHVSHVVHAATSTSLAPGAVEDPIETLGVIVDGTRRALALAQEKGVARMLYASSGAVYGPQPAELSHLPEEHPGAPDPLDRRTTYGQAKRFAEHLGAQARGVDFVVARGFAFVGAHLPLDVHFAIGNFLRDALAGRPVVVSSDGSPRRSYLYGSDLAAWLWVMLARGVGSRAYNLGSDDDRSLGDVAGRVGALLGVPVEVRGRPDPGAPRHRYVPSVARARAELGLEVTVGLDEAIARTARWHRGG